MRTSQVDVFRVALYTQYVAQKSLLEERLLFQHVIEMYVMAALDVGACIQVLRGGKSKIKGLGQHCRRCAKYWAIQ